MNAVKLLVAVTVVCLLGAGIRAEEKADNAKMMVGKWEVTKADEGTVPKGSMIEFTKDGKFKVTTKKDDKDATFDGTYKVEGDSFTYTMKIGDDEHSQTITILKISATEMSTKNKEGKMVELTKKK